LRLIRRKIINQIFKKKKRNLIEGRRKRNNIWEGLEIIEEDQNNKH
jgi:hypothetical protein